MARNKHPEETVTRILDTAMELFLRKGYDNTTIQDIIDALGNLSKGAIYHHFKSKDDIFLAIDERYEAVQYEQFQIVRDRKDLNGLEKLRLLVRENLDGTAPDKPNQRQLITAMPNLLDNPRFLVSQIHGLEKVAPDFLEPLIREGIADGSIHTEHPKEAAEVLGLLANVWVNPLLWHSDKQVTLNKLAYFAQILELMGIPLLDEETIASVNWMLEL